MEFKTFIKAVGTGPKGNRELTFEESVEMMNQMLKRIAPNELIAAFILGWRLKPETNNEYKGALLAMDSFVTRNTIENSIELGYPFDGKASHPFLLPLIARELNKFGINAVVMGDDLIPAKNGVTLKDISKCLNHEKNIYYFDRAIYFKELHALTEIRNMLGVRSAFNTLEKLPNLGNSKFAITGVFHKPYVQKYNAIFEGRYERFALLQGNEGSPEIFNKAKLWITQNGVTEEILIDPEVYGIQKEEAYPQASLEHTLAILKDPNENIIKLAKLNAAILLLVADKVKSIDEGFEKLS